MSNIHAFILGFLQGLSEFLPISSSGHLKLVPELFGWKKMNPSLETTFDVALHAGTLIGAVAYLHKEVIEIIKGLFTWITKRQLNNYARFGLFLLVSAIPGSIIGAALEDYISEHLGQAWLIAIMLIVFGLVLFFADRINGQREESDLTLRDAIIAGVAQVLALQPGVSRSGITMTALRMKGFSREASARLSFLMLIPIVAGATLFTGTKTILGDGIPHDLITPMVIGVITSAITGFIAVYLLLNIVRKIGFGPFVAYRIIAGISVLIFIAVR